MKISVGASFGAYFVVRKLGSSQLGEVYAARHQVTGRRVALRVLYAQYAADTELAQHFLAELGAVNRVPHAGVVAVLDSGEHAGTPYVVMELVAGEILTTRLRRLDRRMTAAESLPIARQLAAILAVTHQQKLSHGDLRTDVVMLEPAPPATERVRLLDFGLGRLRRMERGEWPGSGTYQRRVEPVRIKGVPGAAAYMAPEQLRDLGNMDERTDAYSFGVILYQLLAGRLPFVAASDRELMMLHLLKTPMPLRELDSAIDAKLDGLVQKLLSKAPQERPTMAQVSDVLAPGFPT